MSKPFWIEDPNILISEMNFWPIPTMNKPVNLILYLVLLFCLLLLDI